MQVSKIDHLRALVTCSLCALQYLLLVVERLDAQLLDKLVEARHLLALDLELSDQELVLALECDELAVLL